MVRRFASSASRNASVVSHRDRPAEPWSPSSALPNAGVAFEALTISALTHLAMVLRCSTACALNNPTQQRGMTMAILQQSHRARATRRHRRASHRRGVSARTIGASSASPARPLAGSARPGPSRARRSWPGSDVGRACRGGPEIASWPDRSGKARAGTRRPPRHPGRGRGCLSRLGSNWAATDGTIL